MLLRLIILDTPAMAAASAQQWTPCPRDYQQRKSDQCCSYGQTPSLKLLRLLLTVLHPAVSQIQTPRPVHEEVRVFDILKEELAPTLAVYGVKRPDSVAGLVSNLDINDLDGDTYIRRQIWMLEKALGLHPPSPPPPITLSVCSPSQTDHTRGG